MNAAERRSYARGYDAGRATRSVETAEYYKQVFLAAAGPFISCQPWTQGEGAEQKLLVSLDDRVALAHQFALEAVRLAKQAGYL